MSFTEQRRSAVALDRPSESDWETYRQLAPAAVPRRAEQLAAVVALLPAGTRSVVELGCGEGHLSAAILACLPDTSVLALDGSEQMRELAKARLGIYGNRAQVHPFDLAGGDWPDLMDGAEAVVSSLALHHLDTSGKERVFKGIAERLQADGAFLVADIVEPQRAESRDLFADTWDGAARQQALAVDGTSHLYDLFLSSHWNYYRWPDPSDRPSPLYVQLKLLEQAGFPVVDCFWMNAGHAIFGGYMSRGERPGAVSFSTAMEVVLSMLG
jgi:tRNA (cmo5U34)-methyltransferase